MVQQRINTRMDKKTYAEIQAEARKRIMERKAAPAIRVLVESIEETVTFDSVDALMEALTRKDK